MQIYNEGKLHHLCSCTMKNQEPGGIELSVSSNVRLGRSALPNLKILLEWQEVNQIGRVYSAWVKAARREIYDMADRGIRKGFIDQKLKTRCSQLGCQANDILEGRRYPVPRNAAGRGWDRSIRNLVSSSSGRLGIGSSNIKWKPDQALGEQAA
jgi:hypothetical protein